MDTSTPTSRIGNLDHEVEDSRQMCFEQGKPCVYEPENRPGIIVTEWPNGTTDAHDLEAGTNTRKWPDGTEQTARDTEPLGYPHWPRQKPVRTCRS